MGSLLKAVTLLSCLLLSAKAAAGQGPEPRVSLSTPDAGADRLWSYTVMLTVPDTKPVTLTLAVQNAAGLAVYAAPEKENCTNVQTNVQHSEASVQCEPTEANKPVVFGIVLRGIRSAFASTTADWTLSWSSSQTKTGSIPGPVPSSGAAVVAPTLANSGVGTEAGDKRVWRYTFRAPVHSPSNTQVEIELPEQGSFISVEQWEGCRAQPLVQWVNHRYVLKCDGIPNAPVDWTFRVSGLERYVKDGSVKWSATAGTVSETDKDVPGPTTRYDPAKVRPVFGGGWAGHVDDHIDFDASGANLLAKNPSRARAEGMTGLTFMLGTLKSVFGRHPFKEQKPVGLLVSLEYALDTENILDGFLFGGSIDVNPYVALTIGYSLRRGKGLTPGFKRAAASYVKARQEAQDKQFTGISIKPDGSGLTQLDSYDGLPLAPIRALYTGDPIEDSFNHALHFGVVIPIDFKAMIVGR
jgi:hypothetical protein